MSAQRPLSRPRGVVPVVAAVILGAILITVAPAPAQTSTIPIPSGAWEGTMSLVGRASIAGAGRNTSVGSGRMAFTVDPTTVDGLWELTSQASIELDPSLGMPAEIARSKAQVSTGGTVGGTSDVPALLPTGASIRFDLLGDLEVGPEWQEPWRLDVEVGGCTQLSGVYANSIRETAPGYGIQIAALEGPFQITRVASLAEGTAEAYTAEAERIDGALAFLLATQTEGGGLGGLRRLLEDAETLGRQRRVDASCTTLGQVESILYGQIDALLVAYFGGEVALTGAEVNALVVAAMRTGVLGASSPAPERAAERSQTLRRVLAEQIDAAIQAGDIAQQRSLSAAARTAGFNDLARYALPR